MCHDIIIKEHGSSFSIRLRISEDSLTGNRSSVTSGHRMKDTTWDPKTANATPFCCLHGLPPAEKQGCTAQASLWPPYLKCHPIHPCSRVLPLSIEATRGKARHRVLVLWASVVLTQLLKLRQRQQPQSRLIQMNPGLPGLFIPVGRWWLLCSAWVLICCQWSAAVLARRYQGSGIGGPTESKHRTCPLLIYPRRDGA